jgi:nitrate/nitrite transporter NarK
LKTQFSQKLGNSFEYYFGLLYSLYSLPNIIIPFIGGILVMRFGIRSMYVVFELLIVIGQFIFALGCQSTSMQTMLLGRIIFGLGGESLNICQNAMIVKWFFKSQIALPLGLTISVSRIGSVLNDVFSPRLVSNVTIY